MNELTGSYLDIAKSLPLASDDILFITSDLKRLALACRANGEQFNVNDFIDSFKSVLKNGTIVIPAYTDNLKSGDFFNREKSKPTTGALSNKTFRRSDFKRSNDPLHSVFSWGEHSEEITQLKNKSTLGKGSIFDFLYKNKAKTIVIDVGFQTSFTFTHYIEETLKVKYRKNYTYKINTTIDGKSELKNVNFHTKKPYISTDLRDLEVTYRKIHPSLIYQFYDVNILYIELHDFFDFTVNYIQTGKKLYKYDFTRFTKYFIKKLFFLFKRKN